MGTLIIDGSSVFEIDEECLKRREVPTDCGIEQYLKKKEKEIKKEDR